MFYEEVLKRMYDLLSDPVPRVVANAGACLANFVEGMSKSTLSGVLDKFIKKFFTIL